MLFFFMYHRILPKPFPEAISTEEFCRQLDYLQKNYTFLTPPEVVSYIREGKSPVGNKPCAALSFDDGWLDNWLFATEILKARKLQAVCAVSAGYDWQGELRRSEEDAVLYRSMADSQRAAAGGDFRSYANRAELQAMIDSGVWKLEAHGMLHCQGEKNASVLALPQNGVGSQDFAAFLHDDLQHCCSHLRDTFHTEPEMFFWPWGHYTAESLAVVRESGLLQFTVAKGAIRRGDSRIVLPRIGVSPRWKKFRKNCFVFRHPFLAAIHDLFHTEKVCFDETGSFHGKTGEICAGSAMPRPKRGSACRR